MESLLVSCFDCNRRRTELAAVAWAALNGVSSEKNLPVKWTTEENVVWKVAMPGWSGSTPIIWRDRIFLNVADGDNLSLWCSTKPKVKSSGRNRSAAAT